MEGLHRYFDRVASKRLAPVESSRVRSNQHEFNGVSGLIDMFGGTQRRTIEVLHFDLDDLLSGPTGLLNLTWYDAREAHPIRTEWRLYYDSSLDTYVAPGGRIIFGQRGAAYHCFTARPGGDGEALAAELFPDTSTNRFRLSNGDQLSAEHVSAAAQIILAELGLAPRGEFELEHLVAEEFPHGFPPGETLSAFARRHTFGVDPVRDPDTAITAWLRVELEMFSLLENKVAGKEMEHASSLDEKLAVAMRTFQRRRSRAGKALEYHLKAVFDANGVSYSHTPLTEGGERPDFLFPSVEAYENAEFPTGRLTMLASKQTLRDRWRQVLREAARLDERHLFTTDPGLSAAQRRAMSAAGIRLVLPAEIGVLYAMDSIPPLTMASFIDLLRQRR
ncbi:type II restriction endonuclease [Agromyces neolithicus]|uniref:Type II restriction endonuclease n=1 Tax=Agromyces neolithicus TaxID=269420 RepID=A0ABP4YIG1_9MICO